MSLHRPVRLAMSGGAVLVMVAVVAASQPGPGAEPPVRDVVITVDGPDATTAPPVVPATTASRQVAHDPREHGVSAAALDRLDLPVAAVGAYRSAENVMSEVDPDCGLTWTLLAAIGRVESDHGRYAGATLGSDGVSAPLIRGVALDGAGPVAKIRDTDAGTVDGDRRWDRAVGPMQFLPSTWAAVGVDADGDGVRSADDLDDAALGAAVFLCAASGDLDSLAGRRAAVLRYNPSPSYARDVLAVERAYRSGDYTLPELPTYGDGPRAVRISASAAPDPSEVRQHGQHQGQHQGDQGHAEAAP
ncbi:lytic transglycosylase domain-containing protein, partial [Nocardioides sp.]|uniref:lytic transglycosylase domain-containing protein n=1 Tax=Nocardioides sp. TaxID=35761 RepID=UPI002ED8A57D